MTDRCTGVDIGYGFTKIHNSTGSVSFPTAISVPSGAGHFGEQSPPVTVGDGTYLVGENARHEGSGLLETRTASFVKSNPWLAVLGYALDRAGHVEYGGMVVLGIPPGQYSKSAAEEIVDCISKAEISINGTTRRLRKEDLAVVPQGAGIFFCYASKTPGAFEQDIVVVDIGHYTVDMVCFSNGSYVSNSAKSLPLGISVLLDGLAKAFYSTHGIHINHADAGKLLRQRQLISFGEPRGIEDLDRIAGRYASRLANAINAYCDNLDQVPEVGIAAGGGAALVRGRVSLSRKFYILDRPEMANATGYWLYGRERLAAREG